MKGKAKEAQAEEARGEAKMGDEPQRSAQWPCTRSGKRVDKPGRMTPAGLLRA